MRTDIGKICPIGFVMLVAIPLMSFSQTLSIDPALQEIPQELPKVGKIIKVNVKVSNVKGLFGYQFDVIYDPTALKFKSATEGDFLKAGGIVTFFNSPKDDRKGTVKGMAAMRLLKPGVDGTGVLTTLEFEVIAIKDSKIDLADVKLSDSNSEEIINVKVVGGNVSVPRQDNYGEIAGRKVVYWPPQPELPKGENGGKVELRFWVTPDGSVFNVIIKKKAGSPILERLAREYVEKIRFAELDRRFEPRNQWGEITITFNSSHRLQQQTNIKESDDSSTLYQDLPVQDNYFNRVAMSSSGKLVRFSHMPIKVYVSPRPDEVKSNDFYDNELNLALLEWEKGSDGKVSFQRVSSSSEADIKIQWSRFGYDLSNYDAAGEAQLIQEQGSVTKTSVVVTISIRNKETSQLFSKEEIRGICLHEIGHAIGTWGHSNNKDDIMFPRSAIQTLSQRDKNTIKLVYSYLPEYPMHTRTIWPLLEELKLQPENARLYYQLGSVYLDQKSYLEAISSFKRSLELNPNYFDARRSLALAYHNWGLDLDRHGKVVEAIEQMKIALQLTPQDTNLRFNIALVYEHAERWDEAAAEYESILSSDLQNAQTKNAIINLRLKQGTKKIEEKKYNEALEAYNKIPDNWRDANVYDAIGYALIMQGDLYEAREKFWAALRIDPNNQVAKQNLKYISSRPSQLIASKRTHLYNQAKEHKDLNPKEPDTEEKFNTKEAIVIITGLIFFGSIIVMKQK